MSSIGLHAGLTPIIIGAAIEVHRHLGLGLLESAYEECLAFELCERNLSIARQVPLPVEYKKIRLDCGYRMDLVVKGAVGVELKCVETVMPVHEAQILTYLRLSGLRVGLLLNFHSKTMRDGITRISL